MTSFPILKAKRLSYCENASIVLMYSFRSEVVHEGEARLIDPFKGRETSRLYHHAKSSDKRDSRGDRAIRPPDSQNVDSRIGKRSHTLRVILLRVYAVHSNGVGTELL